MVMTGAAGLVSGLVAAVLVVGVHMYRAARSTLYEQTLNESERAAPRQRRLTRRHR